MKCVSIRRKFTNSLFALLNSVRGFPFPSGSVDELAATNHMVSNKIKHCEEMQMNGIWQASIALLHYVHYKSGRFTRALRNPSIAVHVMEY